MPQITFQKPESVVAKKFRDIGPWSRWWSCGRRCWYQSGPSLWQRGHCSLRFVWRPSSWSVSFDRSASWPYSESFPRPEFRSTSWRSGKSERRLRVSPGTWSQSQSCVTSTLCWNNALLLAKTSQMTGASNHSTIFQSGVVNLLWH